MAESFTISYTDPATGKAVKGSVKRMPTDAELATLKQQFGESVTVSPKEKVTLSKGSMKFPVSAKAAVESLPYAALGLIPGSGLPAIAARVLGAGAISGIHAGEGFEKRDYAKDAKNSMLVQAALEGLTPPAFKFGARLGGGAMRKLEDQIGKELITKIKGAVPWFKSVKDSHEGLRELLVEGKGAALLSENYGKVLQTIKGAVPDTERMTLSIEDATALKIAEKDMVPNLPPELQGKGITAQHLKDPKLAPLLKGHTVDSVTVPTRSVIDLVHGVWKNDPALSQRTLAAIDKALPDLPAKDFTEARRLYREGTNFIQSLKAAHVIDERTGRVSAERLTMGSRALFGEPGKAGTSIAERYKAPEASKIIKEATPKGPAPHAVGPGKAYVSPTGHMGIGGHGGGESVQSVLTQTQPSVTLFSENIPLTPKEEAIKKFVPGAVHALTKAGGVTP